STASVSLFLYAGLAVLVIPGADLCGPQARRAEERGVLTQFCLPQRASGGGGDEFGGEGLAQGGPPRLVRLGQSAADDDDLGCGDVGDADRKSTRLNSSHVSISYAVFCLKKKTQN